MKSYGELVRKIRLEKGQKQKELYRNILSKSYAISFEKGEHDVSFSLLEKLLTRLRVSIDEFQYIRRGYECDDMADFFSSFAECGNSHELAQLEKLLDQCLVGKDRTSRIKTALVRSRLNQLKEFNRTGNYTKSQINLEDRQVIIHHFSLVQTWTYFEILLFSNSIDYIDYQEKNAYFKLIIPFLDKYKQYGPAQDTLCVLFTNLIYDLVMDTHVIQSKPLLDVMLFELKELSKRPAHGFYQIICQVYQGFLTIIFEGQMCHNQDKVNQGEAQARFAIIMLKDVEQFLFASIYTRALDVVLDSERFAELVALSFSQS